MPRNISTEDVLYTLRAPIFITTSEEIIGGNETETNMMRDRLHYFRFPNRIRTPHDYPKCGRCFLKWLIRTSGLDVSSTLPAPQPPPARPKEITSACWKRMMFKHRKRTHKQAFPDPDDSA